MSVCEGVCIYVCVLVCVCVCVCVCWHFSQDNNIVLICYVPNASKYIKGIWHADSNYVHIPCEFHRAFSNRQNRTHSLCPERNVLVQSITQTPVCSIVCVTYCMCVIKLYFQKQLYLFPPSSLPSLFLPLFPSELFLFFLSLMRVNFKKHMCLWLLHFSSIPSLKCSWHFNGMFWTLYDTPKSKDTRCVKIPTGKLFFPPCASTLIQIYFQKHIWWRTFRCPIGPPIHIIYEFG